MPKTKSESVLKHYPPLRAIPEEDWDDIFDRQTEGWTDEDDDVREWYGRDSTINVAYAFGRLPWSIQQRARKLGVQLSRSGMVAVRQRSGKTEVV